MSEDLRDRGSRFGRPVPPGLDIRLSIHAKQRIRERLGYKDKGLLKKIRRSQRQAVFTKDGLRPWITGDGLCVLLVLEKSGTVSGFYEAEVITAITREMYTNMHGLTRAAW